MVSIKLTVYFEDPFYVGVFEKHFDDVLMVAKYTFGALPSDNELLSFLNYHFFSLQFSLPVKDEQALKQKSFKRMQKDVSKEKNKLIGTKSQNAIKESQEANKVLKQQQSKEDKLLQKEEKYLLKKAKQLARHKGH